MKGIKKRETMLWELCWYVHDSIRDDARHLEIGKVVSWWTRLKGRIFFFIDDGNEREDT